MVRVERRRPGHHRHPRPARGAGTRSTARPREALADAFRAFDADADARGGACCAARAARSAPAPTSRRSATGRRATGSSPTATVRWARRGMLLSKPVIAAIAGHAVAGGLELALWCDLRVADDDAVLGVFCRRWGVPLIDGGTVRLPRLIGLSRALDLILTGRAVTADEALAIGLANRVVPNGRRAPPPRRWRASSPRSRRRCLRADRRSAYDQYDLAARGRARQRARARPGRARPRRGRRGALRRGRRPARPARVARAVYCGCTTTGLPARSPSANPTASACASSIGFRKVTGCASFTNGAVACL